MRSKDRPFEAWSTAGGVCMTPEALAIAADVLLRDVFDVMVDWSEPTCARCLYRAEGEAAKLNVAGVRLMLETLAEEEVADTILRRLAAVEASAREREANEPPA